MFMWHLAKSDINLQGQKRGNLQAMQEDDAATELTPAHSFDQIQDLCVLVFFCYECYESTRYEILNLESYRGERIR